MNSDQSSEMPSNQPASQQYSLSKWLLIGIMIASFIGFSDATYLTIQHFTGASVKCIVSSGCDTVTTSEYAIVFGIPMALLGALFYLGIFLFTILYFDIRKRVLMYLVSLGTVFGFLFSLYLIYLQIFVLHAICEYCMLSATTSTILFVFGLIVFFKLRYRQTQ